MDLIIKTSTGEDKKPSPGYLERDNIADNPAVTKALKLIDEAILNLKQGNDPKYEEAIMMLEKAKELCQSDYSEEDKSMMGDVSKMKDTADKSKNGFMDKVMNQE